MDRKKREKERKSKHHRSHRHSHHCKKHSRHEDSHHHSRHGDRHHQSRSEHHHKERSIIKDIYIEHPDVKKRSKEEVDAFRSNLKIDVFGHAPNPITNFRECIFPDPIMEKINYMKFEKPTPIQAQGWPIMLSGRDMVGIARTGSGKTLAYALPAILHLIKQRQLEENKSRLVTHIQVLILAPTRELAQQINDVCCSFSEAVGVNTCCFYGGASKESQLKVLKLDPKICIATPGRLIDFVNSEQIDLREVSFLILDEADRMLEEGFQEQIDYLICKTQKKRQTVMLSATWPSYVEDWARLYLNNEVQVCIGNRETINPNIIQKFEVVEEENKAIMLKQLIKKIGVDKKNKALVFAATRSKVKYLTRYMQGNGFSVEGIHGELSQRDRNWVLNGFRIGNISILVATDVASRGLDISDIKYVVNVDFPNRTEDYIHRIGRTARMDHTGTAYSFITLQNAKHVFPLIQHMRAANQEISPALLQLAEMGQPQKRKRSFAGNYDSDDDIQYLGTTVAAKKAKQIPKPPANAQEFIPPKSGIKSAYLQLRAAAALPKK